MSSPFTIFRRHQRVMMVVITGLSMISFVLLGAVQDPRQLPTPLVVIFLAAMAGGVAWLAGLRSGKGSEWGLTGALIGAIFAIAVTFYNREASAVLIDNGNLSTEQVSELRRQRFIVNRFVALAFQQTQNVPLQSLPAPLQRSFLFGFSNNEDVTIDDVVVGELLRREADKMGIVISDKMVTDFITRVTTKKGLMETFDKVKNQMNPQEAAMWGFYLPTFKEKPMTAPTFAKIRKSLQVSETGLLNAIRDELKAAQAYQLLSGNNYFPPEQFWTYYQQMNVKQSAEVASIPVKDFIDPQAKPTDDDLAKLFAEYRQNFPGFTPEGKPEPGRPGFYQPRRFQLGYLEAVYDEIEPNVGEVTEEEIQKAYEDKYLKKVPTDEMPAGLDLNLDGPDLPPAPSTEKPAAPASPEAPAEGTPPAEKPAEEPAKPETPETTEKPAEEAPAPSPEPKTEEPKTEEPAPEPTSSLMQSRATQQVAFFQDEEAAPPAEAPATESAEAPKSEPAPETPADKPAEEKPAETEPATPAPEGEAPAAPAGEKMPANVDIPPAPSEEIPAAPTTEVPPLDDALKALLKADILKQRTKEAIQKRMEAAQIEMSRISENLQREKTDKDYITLEDATKELELYAAQNQLQYVVTPPLSYQELAQSENYPIGQAFMPQQRMTVADAMYRTAPTDLYRVSAASNFNPSSAYVFWKLSDKAAFAPNSIDDGEGIRAQVVEAWNIEQARPKAKARAEALAKMIRESDKPMGEVLTDQTITGNVESIFVPVHITGEFTWMQKPIVPPTGMQQQMPVRPSVVPGVPDAGEEFFTTVFNDLKVGDIGIAPNNDHTNYYVVKIESRDPSTPEQVEAMQKKFLSEGLQAGYSSLLQQSLAENSINWLQQLFDDHEVVIQRRD
ncbi:hypothetical protein SH661x_001023 [Planctomicrobium sp. SH661]|uniref:hypothetical protein n=1 Tax=Planctomicrobium sp. SH661 TaxID=3448124 RepID=UPI003F5B0BA0